MNYKRLTKRDGFGNADIIGLDSSEIYGELDFDETNILTKALNRFATLEDKLENGTLIELPIVAMINQTLENGELMNAYTKCAICKNRTELGGCKVTACSFRPYESETTNYTATECKQSDTVKEFGIEEV